MSLYLPSNASDTAKLLGLIPHPEGGFFLETFRSGVDPMSTRGKTQRQGVADRDLVVTQEGRKGEDGRRHCLTSIYWMPTTSSPVLGLGLNASDHVHYYHGGQPFLYIIYNPTDQTLSRVILGPDLANGHQLQVCVPGGVYKCGRMILDAKYRETMTQDYTLLGEGVGPGFDEIDFKPITSSDVQGIKDTAIRDELVKYLFTDEGVWNFDSFYDENELRATRAKERS